MNNRTISTILIVLCGLSIVVGIFNLAFSSPSRGGVNNSQNFSGIFGGSANGYKIAVVTLNGPITSDLSDGLLGEMYSAQSVEKSLRRASRDNSVKGVIIKINSPGGTVAMSQEIYSTVMRLRKRVPVVVSMSDLAASGGYYIASAADRIYAEPGTLTGSIGVIMSAMDAHELLTNKLGIKSEVIKSGKFKDIASPYRPITSDERSLLQNLINTTYQQFLKAIIAGRVDRNDLYTVKKSDLTVAVLNKYADGRVLNGELAQKLGFVDQLGGMYEAEKAVASMAITKFNLPKNTKLQIVTYNRPGGLGETLFGMSKSFFPQKDQLFNAIPLSAKYPHQTLLVWE